MNKFRSLYLVVIVLLVGLLSGCGALQWAEDNDLAARIITNQTTLRFIEAADNPQERAQLVVTRAGDLARAVDINLVTSIAELEGYVRDNIDWSRYGLADQDLLDTAITLAAAELTKASQDLDGAELGLQPDDVIRIKTLLEWITQAASRAL